VKESGCGLFLELTHAGDSMDVFLGSNYRTVEPEVQHRQY
jgi:hypothetical protein